MNYAHNYRLYVRKLIHHIAYLPVRGRIAIDADVQTQRERIVFFSWAQLSLGASQVSIVGPSNNSQPLILNPLVARIRRQTPIYRFWNNGDRTAPRMRTFIK